MNFTKYMDMDTKTAYHTAVADRRDVLAYKKRVREAVTGLDKGLIREFQQGMDREGEIREVLQEIIGSANAIAEKLGIEL